MVERETGLPLPLGGNVLRKDIAAPVRYSSMDTIESLPWFSSRHLCIGSADAERDGDSREAPRDVRQL